MKGTQRKGGSQTQEHGGHTALTNNTRSATSNIALLNCQQLLQLEKDSLTWHLLRAEFLISAEDLMFWALSFFLSAECRLKHWLIPSLSSAIPC